MGKQHKLQTAFITAFCKKPALTTDINISVKQLIRVITTINSYPALSSGEHKMLWKSEKTISDVLQMGKPELPVQPSSNLRSRQLPARRLLYHSAGDYLHSRAGGNECLISSKSFHAEVQELSMNLFRHLGTSGTCRDAVLLCRLQLALRGRGRPGP